VQIRVFFLALTAALLLGASPAARADLLGDVLTAPKTLIDLAIEARSSEDIVEDNKIVLRVNEIMADLGTIKASTEIYEQRLLVTGMFDDEELYAEFKDRVEDVNGVRELYWYVVYMSEDEQEARDDELLDWSDALLLDTDVGLALVGTAGVADVNFRVAADTFGTIYLLGRARSEEEGKKAVDVAEDQDGVRRVLDFVEVRP
jgi:osmotically-inducible protein OsmY